MGESQPISYNQVLMTAEKAAEMGCTPLAKIVGYADGATDPIDFPIAPKFALDKLMAQVFPFSVIVHVRAPSRLRISEFFRFT